MSSFPTLYHNYSSEKLSIILPDKVYHNYSDLLVCLSKSSLW